MMPLWHGDAERGVQVVRLDTADDGGEAEPLVRLFEGIAANEGWEPGDGLRRWQNRSVYFGLEVEGHLAGGLQLVLPDAANPALALPCQMVWPEVPVSATAGGHRVAHVAVLALDKAVRGDSLFFWNVVVEMWRYCVAEGIATVFIEVTPRVLPLYQRLGWPLVIQGQLRRHWGEDCYLCTLGIPEVAEALLRRAERSGYYRQIIAQAFRVTLAPPRPSAEKAAQVRERRAPYGRMPDYPVYAQAA
jgi:hypothetical protein